MLSVSNQPVWSDTWAIGGLFLASALSGSAALLVWYAHASEGSTIPGDREEGAPPTEARLAKADGYFAVLELVLIVIFFVTIGAAGTLAKTFIGFG